MASVERIEQELAKTEKQLEKAEAALKEFKEDENGGKWLDELRGKLRSEKGTEAQQERWEKEKEKLEKKEERLEQAKEERLKQVEELQRAYTATTAQPGNDFVTRVHRVE